jgi:hypothetical protein
VDEIGLAATAVTVAGVAVHAIGSAIRKKMAAPASESSQQGGYDD